MPEPVPLLEETYDYDKSLLPEKPIAAPLSIVETTKDDDEELNNLISQYIVNDDPAESKKPSNSQEADVLGYDSLLTETQTKEKQVDLAESTPSPKNTLKKKSDEELNETFQNNSEMESAEEESNEINAKNESGKDNSEEDEEEIGESSSSENEESETEEVEYEVEAIVGHVWKDGEKRYLVKWKGYSSRHNTIEPIENLCNCKSLIDSHERSLTSKRQIVEVVNGVLAKKLKINRQSPQVHRKNLKDSSEESSKSSSEEVRMKRTSKVECKEDLAKQALQLIKAKRSLKEKSPVMPVFVPKKNTAIAVKASKSNGPSLFPNLSKNATPLGSKASGGKNFKTIFPPLNGAKGKILKKEIKPKHQSSSPLPIYIQEESSMNGSKPTNIEEEVEVEQAMPIECEIETQAEEEVFDPFEDARKLKEYLEGMEAFKAKLSALSGAPVTVVNEQDMRAPPADFSFIQMYTGIHFDAVTSTSKEGCACGNGVCISSICKCNLKHGKKKHRESDLQPLYECNSNCPCGSFCPNRRIQREGRTVPLEIFRTKKKGWGLKALRDVLHDEFIDRYVGEVLTPTQADERPDTTYQFDLDYCYEPDEQGDYVVDARFIGGPCRFMNHSCDPNCYVRPMFIWGRDEKLPEIGFFAKRDIKAGEELTFDYFCDQKTKGTYRCSCNAPQCKGYLFS